MKPRVSVICPTIRPQGLDVVYESLKGQDFQDFEFLTDISFPSKGHDLNASYNRLIRRSNGELIVSWQDFIKAPPETLMTFWAAYMINPTTFFTCPVGKTMDWENIKYDWRATRPDTDITYDHCEFDLGCFPKKAIYDIGGFDEALDKLWSMDNISVCMRAEKFGYKFKNIPELKAVAYDHDMSIEHPFRKDYKPALSNLIMDDYKDNPKLNYLHS